MKIKKIIITGAGGPAGVNFINSLREAPETLHLIAVDSNPFHLEWANADEKYVIPRADHRDYFKALRAIIKKTKADFLHPQPDNEVLAISEHRDQLPIRVFLPRRQTIRICQDKYLSAQYWRKAHIHTQRTLYATQDQTSLKRVARLFGYPYWLRASKGASSRGSTPVPNLTTARSWIQYWRARSIDWKFIAQEHLSGRNIAFQSLWNNGQLITSQARQRIEYIYPQLAPSGVTNTPVIAKTINDGHINEIAQRAVLAIDAYATGIFCVDIKEDKHGNPIPTEINCGRFFTTSYFFTKAGINMPYYYIKLGFGEKIPSLPKVNAVPKNWYWCRHIDCPPVLIKDPTYAND